MDEDFRVLLRETAGMRLVLVHILARLPRAELSKISEGINKDLAQMDAHSLNVEAAMMPYHATVDDIFARALQIQESER